MKIKFAKVEHSFNKVRDELKEVGLLTPHSNKYLDKIDLEQIHDFWFSEGEVGETYDEDPWIGKRLFGFKLGNIYLPQNANVYHYISGCTIDDVIRHEFAHSWAAIDPRLFKQKWFVETFGGQYFQDDSRFSEETIDFYMHNYNMFTKSEFFDGFISPYALALPKEDFAETFMMFLRYRKSYDRFAKRQGVMKKLKAVQRIINSASVRARARSRIRHD